MVLVTTSVFLPGSFDAAKNSRVAVSEIYQTDHENSNPGIHRLTTCSMQSDGEKDRQKRPVVQRLQPSSKLALMVVDHRAKTLESHGTCGLMNAHQFGSTISF